MRISIVESGGTVNNVNYASKSILLHQVFVHRLVNEAELSEQTRRAAVWLFTSFHVVQKAMNEYLVEQDGFGGVVQVVHRPEAHRGLILIRLGHCHGASRACRANLPNSRTEA